MKEFTYIPYTKEELEDKFIREEYKKHSDSARKEERDKFKTVFIIWFIIFVILMIIGRFEFSVIWKWNKGLYAPYLIGCIINGVDRRNFYQCHFLIKKSWDNKIFLLKLNRQK